MKQKIKQNLPQIRQMNRDEVLEEPKKIAESALEQIIKKKANAKVAQKKQTAQTQTPEDQNEEKVSESPQYNLKRIERLEEEMRQIRLKREKDWQDRIKEKEDEKKKLLEETEKEEAVPMPSSRRSRGMLGGKKGPVDKNKKGELKSG